MNKYILLLTGLVLSINIYAQSNHEKYEETWKSITKIQTEPEWLKDAKFGIYTHWGPSTYPISLCEEVAGWYPHGMYERSNYSFDFHKKTFGDQHQVGYKDLIPLFTAKNFDAEEWAALFKKAGARFAGPVAVHHDNYCLWNSKSTRWNSMDMEPHRDIVGELEKAIRAKEMKFFTSMHHSYTWFYYQPAYEFDAKNPQYADLYCEPHAKGDKPSELFLDSWFKKIKEITDNYKPDLLYFDFGLGMIPEKDRLKMLAYTYNQANKENRDYIVVYKKNNLHQGSGIYDYEVHYPMVKQDNLWITDLSVTNWFPFKYSNYEYPNTLIDRLIDIVSKNGILLLNIPPDYTGKIPEKSKEILTEIGEWLQTNGEAIYNTRPWNIYGYGPYEKMNQKEATKVGWSTKVQSPFTADDVRFTISKDHKNLYVFFLDLPISRRCKVSHISSIINQIDKIKLLGYKKKLKWEKVCDEIVFTYPKKALFNKAFVLKIILKQN